MKNYDVKSSTIDLTTKSRINVQGKRLAYLVPNMFNKITSGYGKKIAAYMSSQTVAAPAPVQSSVPPVKPEVTTTIPVNEPKIDVNQTNPISNEVKVTSEEKTTTVENQAPETSEKVKNYSIKALSIDVDYLKNRQLRVSGSPRKLLISTVFVQKLVTHRFNAIKANLDARKVEPVVPNKEPEVTAPADTKEAGVVKYVELMNKRKEAITIKQTCEKEMTELVNKFGITLDMVNAELAKGNVKKIG
jgi:hypothetical protein